MRKILLFAVCVIVLGYYASCALSSTTVVAKLSTAQSQEMKQIDQLEGNDK